MRKVHRKPLWLAAALLLTVSCAHIRYQNQTRVPVSFTHNLGENREYKVVRHVDNDYRRVWLVFYLIPMGKDGSDMIADSASGADGMVNLKIKTQYSFVDVLVTNLTLGLCCMRTVNVQGDLVEITGPASVSAAPRSDLKPAGAESKPGFCPACGKQNRGNTKFCTGCGAALPAK